jgi:hypothetical protein
MSYEPQPGTIPHRVIAWLKEAERLEPGKEFPAVVICECLDIELAGFSSCMDRARVAGLVRARRPDPAFRNLVWSLGDGKAMPAAEDPEDAAMAPKQSVVAAADAAPMVPVFIDPLPPFLDPKTRQFPAASEPAKPSEFDLQVSLRNGTALLFVPGHGAVPLTSEQREQLVEWLSAGRTA